MKNGHAQLLKVKHDQAKICAAENKEEVRIPESDTVHGGYLAV